MKTVDMKDFIQKLEELKANANNEKTLTPYHKEAILERKLSELNWQSKQLQEDFQKQTNEFFEYLLMKQANMEVIATMQAYVDEEKAKIEEQLAALRKSNSA